MVFKIQFGEHKTFSCTSYEWCGSSFQIDHMLIQATWTGRTSGQGRASGLLLSARIHLTPVPSRQKLQVLGHRVARPLKTLEQLAEHDSRTQSPFSPSLQSLLAFHPTFLSLPNST